MATSMEVVAEEVKKLLLSMGESSKLALDSEAGILRIYGEGSDYVGRAKSGLSEVQELAYTTAEHHPYWGILYHAAEIAKVVLDSWDLQLTEDQKSEISWRSSEIRMAVERMQDT